MRNLRIGIAGLGVVGSAVLDILENHQKRTKRRGAGLNVTAVSATTRNKDRGVSLEGLEWYDDPVELASSDKIDVFVELIGGANGPAHDAVSAALRHGKHVVTANKAMIAEHGPAIARLAEDKGLSVLYEAAVAGGIPVIRGLRDGAGACRVTRMAGLLNGTCNYILTQMTRDGASYEDALREAQQLGYAEADPAFDVSGADAAQKLSILGMIAFDSEIQYGAFPVQGIEAITAGDIVGAGKLGFRIKLVALARQNEDGCEMRVHPALIDEEHSLAKADGAENYVLIDCEPLGRLTFTGPGAGGGATAAAVVADLITLSRGVEGPVFGSPAELLQKIRLVSPESKPSRYYLRLKLKDVPGAIAGISETLAESGISIDSLIQPSVSEADKIGAEHHATVMLVTHRTSYTDISSAAGKIRQKPFALGEPSIIRVENFD